MKHTVDAMGKQCPIPVVMTKKILDKAEQGDEIQVLVDNETAVNNLSRLAGSTGCSFVSRKTEDGYEIHMVVKSDLCRPELLQNRKLSAHQPYHRGIIQWPSLPISGRRRSGAWSNPYQRLCVCPDTA